MKTASGELRKAIVTKLTALNLPIKKDVKTFPRVELVEVTENTPIDKDDKVREMGFVLEAISNSSYQAALDLQEDIAEGLSTASALTMTGFDCVILEKELSTEIQEVGEGDVLITRLRNQYRAVLSERDAQPQSNNQ